MIILKMDSQITFLSSFKKVTTDHKSLKNERYYQEYLNILSDYL